MILEVACAKIVKALEKMGCETELVESDKFDFINATLPAGVVSHVMLRRVNSAINTKVYGVKLANNNASQTVSLRVYKV